MRAIAGPEDNRFFVGVNGSIVRCVNRSYAKESSPTTIDLTDVSVNDTEVWAVGGRDGSQESVRMRRWNGAWTIMDSVIAPFQSSTYAVWCDEKGLAGGGFVVCAGYGVTYFDSTKWNTLPPGILEGILHGVGWYNAVRGTARNNVFAAGEWNVVVHFNGRRWKCMTELITYPSASIIDGVAVTKNKVFLVGGQANGKGFIITGTRIP